MGQSVPRVDIPAKVTGGAAYVQDLRLPGMLHARVVRPPSYGARLIELDTRAVEAMPGVITVVRDGNFLAVVAERECQAIKAMRALAAARASGTSAERCPTRPALRRRCSRCAREDRRRRRARRAAAGGRVLEATYTRPYQMHGSIGPSCAVAQLDDGALTVWTHTQGVFPDRDAIAEMLGMPNEQVRCIHMEGAGCYGHNGADDAAADAALIARACRAGRCACSGCASRSTPGSPTARRWSTEVERALDAGGHIVGWDYERLEQHARHAAGRRRRAARRAAPRQRLPPRGAEAQIKPAGNGDRNAMPLYNFPNMRVVQHFIPDMPVRVSALRALGAYCNVFAIESFMDELALGGGRRSGGVPPAAPRRSARPRRHQRSPPSASAGRRRSSCRPAAAAASPSRATRTSAAYCAVAVEVEVDRETGASASSAPSPPIDSGEVVNPDGIRNQTEGGILQSMSWTLYEEVTFDATRITSVDWASYPILRFAGVPDASRCTSSTAPGPALPRHGRGVAGPDGRGDRQRHRRRDRARLRDLPFTREKVKAAIGV